LLGCNSSTPSGALALPTDTLAPAPAKPTPGSPAPGSRAPGSCAVARGGCDANATCTPTGAQTNTYACKTGYAGDGKTCAPTDQCSVTNKGGCDANATCTSTGPGTNTCACKTGYAGSGTV
jgi:hypothetical protein